MQTLEEENITAFKYLEQGGFSGSLTGKPHSRIPFDQVIELTINRSCKDVGGLSGNTKSWCNGKVDKNTSSNVCGT